MRTVLVGQVLSPKKDVLANAIADIDSNGVATLKDCGDSSFARYDTKKGIVVVGEFDGVGSTLDTTDVKGDALSSKIACKVISNNLVNLDESKIARQLYYSAFMAHVEMNTVARQKSLYLSTTATYGVVFPNANAYILNSGDSRAYRFDGNDLNMLTLDDRSFSDINELHESVKQLYESLQETGDAQEEIIRALQGFQTEEECWDFFGKKITFRDIAELNLLLGFQETFSNFKFKTHDEVTDTSERVFGSYRAGIINRGNRIVRSISSGKIPHASITKVQLNEGDILLFCTDGLSDVLPTDDIRDCIKDWQSCTPTIIARMLVDLAREQVREKTCYKTRNKEDDIGAVVVKFGEKS